MREADSVALAARLARDTADLVEMGIPLVEALDRLRSGAATRESDLLKVWVNELRGGSTLAQALERHPGPFPERFVRAVSVGEAAESLPRALKQAADLMESDQRHRMAVSLALLYPRIVLIMLAVLVWGLFALVVPTFVALFEGMNAVLPAPTRLILAASQLATNPVGLVLVAGLALVLWGLLSNWPGWDSARLRLPLLGEWIARHQAISWLGWLNVLVEQGVALPTAVRLAAQGCSPAFREATESAAASLDGGSELAQALREHAFFPPLGAWLVGRQEQAEFQPGGLARVAQTLQRELTLTAQRRLAIIEPLAVVAVAFLVGFVVISVFLPLYQLIGNLG